MFGKIFFESFLCWRRKIYKKSHKAHNKKLLMPKRVSVQGWDYGLYAPHLRYNVDQVPFVLDNQHRCSYVPHEQRDKVNISGPQDGSKRFGTLQVCFHPGGPHIKQPKLAIFFKGEGNVFSPTFGRPLFVLIGNSRKYQHSIFAKCGRCCLCRDVQNTAMERGIILPAGDGTHIFLTLLFFTCRTCDLCQVYQDEKSSYHSGVNVQFQKNAWFTKTIGLQWINETLEPHVKDVCGDSAWVIAQDNLRDQKDWVNFQIRFP